MMDKLDKTSAHILLCPVICILIKTYTGTCLAPQVERTSIQLRGLAELAAQVVDTQPAPPQLSPSLAGGARLDCYFCTSL